MKRRLSDHDKLEQLYLLYEQRMYAIAYGILHQVEQAEDAVQESFIKIIKHLDKIKDPGDNKTKGYVTRIVTNTAIDTYRKNQREFKRTIQAEQQVMEEMNSYIDVHLDHLLEEDHMKNLINELPPIYVDVVMLRCFYEYSVKETADILKISPSTVKKRYERAKKILLKEKGEEINEMAKELRPKDK